MEIFPGHQGHRTLPQTISFCGDTGHIKTVLYQHGKEYAGLDELKRSINTISEGITCRQLANVRGEFYDRLSYCVHAGGNIFEHLI